MRRSRQTLSVVIISALLGSLLIQTAVRVVNAQKSADQPVIARIKVKSQLELDKLITLDLDLLETREGNDLFFLTTPEQIRQLRQQGWKIRVDTQQTALLRQQRPDLRQSRAKDSNVGTAAFMGGYLTVPEMRAFLDDRAAQYPDLAEVFVYGSSWERLNQGGTAGHDLFGIKLTNKLRPGPKPTFFLMAAIHARELSVSELALRFVNHLLSGYGVDADATWLLDEHLIVVLPVVNPDGRRIAEQGYYQRKNTNPTNGIGCANPPTPTNQSGVDLNRNYSFKWGTVNPPSTNPCAQTYPGPVASSEPETAALQDLVRSLFPDQRGPLDTDAAPPTTTGLLITLHSYSDLVLWPWGHSSTSAPNGADLSLIGTKFAGYNGYTPQQAIQLYPTSGTTDDWSYGELGIPSYTFEVGRSSGACGGFMPPYSCLDGGSGGAFWPRNLPAFLYAARIARAPYQLGHGPTPETLTAISGTPGLFELRVQLDEQRNGGQRIMAAEYYVDTPPWGPGSVPIAMTPADGSFNSTTEVATATVNTLVGRHMLYVRGQDESGNWGPVRAVYSPEESCSYSINPTGQSFAPGGGTGVVDVTAGANCGWTATVDVGANWITLTSGSSGTGNGTVNYTVSANGGNSSRSATITIADQTFTVTQDALRLNTLSLSPTSVTGGKSSVGTVTLNAPAPSTGAKVFLSSSNTAAATTPASVTVAAGATTKTFNVNTFAVSAPTSVQISANYQGGTETAALQVSPPVLTALSLSPSSITAPCQASTGKVTLSGKAPAGGVLVNLANDNPAASVPASVTVPAGATLGTFTITASQVSVKAVGNVTATPADPNFGTTNFSKTLTVLPIGVKLLTLSPNPADEQAVYPNMGAVILACPVPAGGTGVTVNLTSTTTAVAAPSVPSLTFAPGSGDTLTFAVQTKSVAATSYATIMAKPTNGGTAKSVKLQVNNTVP